MYFRDLKIGERFMVDHDDAVLVKENDYLAIREGSLEDDENREVYMFSSEETTKCR